jgi:hypothetical protein
MKGRQLSENVLFVRHAAGLAEAHRVPLFVGAVDLRAAYNLLDINVATACMQHKG